MRSHIWRAASYADECPMEAEADNAIDLCAAELGHGPRVVTQQVAMAVLAVEHDAEQHAVVLVDSIWLRDEDGFSGTMAAFTPVDRCLSVGVEFAEAVDETAQTTVGDAVSVAMLAAQVAWVEGW